MTRPGQRRESPPELCETGASLDTAHEWVSFADPEEDRTWLVDVSFLASPWRCVYGSTCEGVRTAPAGALAEGCCSYGAHFSGEDDLARVEAAAERLGPAQWQYRSLGRRKGIVRRQHGEIATRIVADACIFLNRPGFRGGAGCALHRGALEEGVAPLSTKPDVCWQLPLRRDDMVDALGHVTTTLSQWERRHWGPAGLEFHWWCTEAPEAFVSTVPVYVSLAAEIVALTSPALYAMVLSHMDLRGAVALPHPALRRGHRPPSSPPSDRSEDRVQASPAQSGSGSASSASSASSRSSAS